MAKVKNFADIGGEQTDDFNEDALTTTTAGQVVLNFGNLTATGDLANGIFGGANDVTLRHFGSIETTGTGAAGIYVQGENARIENFGSVITTGTFTDDFLFFAEGIFAEGDQFYIANHGSVQVSGEGSTALVGAGADGRVINFGIVDSSATQAAVIAAFGDRTQVINAGSGEVIARGEGPALFVEGQDASALNRGKVTIVEHSLINGMEGLGQNTHLTNKGVISISADADGSLGMVGRGSAHQISNFGLIETHANFTLGIGARDFPGGTGLDFEIFNSGRIVTDGDLAIGVLLGAGRLQFGFGPATNGQIENRGVIETVGDGSAGVVMIGDGHHLTNSGRITTDGGAFGGGTVGLPVGELRAAGVVVSGDDALVENSRKGVIRSEDAASAAVELNVLERDGLLAADMSSTLENFGLIRGAAVAVLGGAGEETVINHGRIVGNVNLGSGDDTFVFAKNGVLTGDLLLGEGADLVVVKNGSGTTEIADFVAGAASGDAINVSAFFSDFGELQDAMEQNGSGDVVIALDSNDTLVLTGVQLDALNAGDFIFAV